jgi:hypothetical protein
MSKFKACDLVTPIDTSFYGFKDTMEDLMGKVLVVTQVLPDTVEKNIRAGISGYESHYWRSDDLRLVCAAQYKLKDTTDLKEQSKAWANIVKTLDEVMPGWTIHHKTAEAAAIAAIQKLARKTKKKRK